MKDESLRGKYFKIYARCSTASQADTSIKDQLKAIRNFAALNEMLEVGQPIVHGGISGSLDRSAAELLDAVGEARNTGEDFTLVVVYDESRFTRQGMDAGAVFEHELGKWGVELISVVGYCPADEFTGMRKGFNREAARYQAQSIGISVSRGAQTSLEEGRSVGCTTPPFGTDKLILTADGKPLWVLRHNADGSQDQIDPATREVKQNFSANLGPGGTSHYRKAKSERVALIPAQDDRAETVRRIFLLHDGEGKGAHVIAGILNDACIPSPRGRQWYASTVLHILNNPAYIGLDIANRRSSAIYARRSPNAPKVLPRKKSKFGWDEIPRKRPVKITRPRQEWFESEHAALVEFLPADIRAVADKRIRTRLDQEAMGRVPKPNERGGGKRSFLLTNLLRSTQGNHPMIGHPGGSRNRPKRYYKIPASIAKPGEINKVLRKNIPAEPVEAFVVEHLRRILCDLPDMADRFLAHLTAQSKQEFAESQASALQRQIELLDNKIQRLIYASEEMDLKGFSAQLSDLQGRREEADTELRALSEAQPPDEATLREIARNAHALLEALDEMPVEVLRPIVEIFVTRITVDLETRLVEAEFAIPDWASLAAIRVGEPPAPVYKNRRFTNVAPIELRRTETFQIPSYFRWGSSVDGRAPRSRQEESAA